MFILTGFLHKHFASGVLVLQLLCLCLFDAAADGREEETMSREKKSLTEATRLLETLAIFQSLTHYEGPANGTLSLYRWPTQS